MCYITREGTFFYSSNTVSYKKGVIWYNPSYVYPYWGRASFMEYELMFKLE